MIFTLKRTDYRSDGIFSTLIGASVQSAEFNAVTLEHAYQQPDGLWVPKLQPGTYTLRRRKSPHFGVDVFQIMNVVGHNFMEIHWGSLDADSDGCILLGEKHVILNGAWIVTGSRDKFAEFMKLLEGQDEAKLVVIS